MDRSVCFCNSNRAWGGGEKWHLGAALGLARRGCRVFLMAGEGTPLYERAKEHPELILRPERFGNLSFLNPLRVSACASYFKRNAISRVVLGLPSDLKAAGFAAHRARVPGIFYRRGIALPVKDTALNRIAYGRFLTGLITNSRETARLVFAENATIMDKSKVHVLYNGLDIAAFDAANRAAHPSFREPGETLVIGSAGRLTAQKGQHFLLHMSRVLLDAGVAHKLVLAGDGALREELFRLAAELGLGDTVRFTGFLANMAPFWQSIDMFVLPSLWEGFGYALAEAMLAEKPVMAFDGNSMPEVVRSGETGLLIPMPQAGESPASVGARLAAALLSIAEDPALGARFAAAGRHFCIQNFDQERCLDSLCSLLWPGERHG